IEVVDIPEGICLTQRKYCTELLYEFGMLACKPCGTPIESNPENKKLVLKFGDDEALTVHCLSQVMHSPMKSHLRLAFRVLSEKQSVVSRSSTEAEFRAMYFPIEMNYDNNSAIPISANPVLHERSKHFEIDLYFLREKVTNGLKPNKVKSEDNIANLFTKGLTISDHNKFCCSVGLFNPFQVKKLMEECWK
ncbi:ribonuclease H-like domain-containing protein, partial [Tanacetum coccineum]